MNSCLILRSLLLLFLVVNALTSSTTASVIGRDHTGFSRSEQLLFALESKRNIWETAQVQRLRAQNLASSVRQDEGMADSSESSDSNPSGEETEDNELPDVDSGADEIESTGEDADGTSPLAEEVVDTAPDPDSNSSTDDEVVEDNTAVMDGEDEKEEVKSEIGAEEDETEKTDAAENTESGTEEEAKKDVTESKSSSEDGGNELLQSDAVEGVQADANKTDPYDAFVLMQMVETAAVEAFEMVTIFKNGSFVGPFANNPETPSSVIPITQDDESWYTDSEYADRIAFQFTYEPESEDYEISEPQISSGSSRGVVPTVQDFKNDGSMGAGSFTILYHCRRDAEQVSHISLKMQVTADRHIQTTWTKKCGRGRHEHIEFGFTAHDHSLTLFNADGTYGTDEQRTLEVGPMETSTELSMKLSSPAQNLQFSAPYVFSGSESISVQLRGTISDGTLSSDSATIFTVIYDCDGATTGVIDFSLEIPPWDNITAQWRKDCGGSHSQALLIGTTGKDSFDVMQDGELASLYNVTDKTSLDDANGVISVIPEDVDTKRFYLTNSDDTSDIHIQTITTTMSDPKILTASVETPVIGTSYLPSIGDVIRRHETKLLWLHFVCKREGRSLVLVTLPTLRYKNVEFGFVKVCDEPKVYHHSGFLQTASSLIGTVLTLGILAAIGTCLYMRRRQGAKYSAVSTNDSMIP